VTDGEPADDRAGMKTSADFGCISACAALETKLAPKAKTCLLAEKGHVERAALGLEAGQGDADAVRAGRVAPPAPLRVAAGRWRWPC
jgi:hypothetical protein